MITASSQIDTSYHHSERLEDYIILLKPRVMSLVVFTGLCGLLMAPGKLHPLLALIAVICIAVGAGASGALNMWYDRDIDLIMQRTQNRPLPQNKINPDNALAFGTILSLLSVLIMGVAVNWIAAAWLAFTIFFYVFIYTFWLKRRTPQNIVIGGAAGALPPVVGWAAVTGTTPLEAWILFLIIFMWTPAHFWALSLHRNQDYVAAKVPMMPVVAGEKSTKNQIIVYAVLTVISTMLPLYVDMSSFIYGWFAGALGLIFVGMAIQLRLSNTTVIAMRLFGYSILYLFLIFLSLMLDSLVR
ncbi:heme o synthase [Candidatus Odyssella thessalonicensis]|uniref:heme o synthase n=1 Tax=Candidatus Odyssella thessalonicensis TaxID=84647 RepID=UPI0004955304|nr:heme o synthase [Candidatus Odyssella thessalonicensis]